jgi:hypothetical protein
MVNSFRYDDAMHLPELENPWGFAGTIIGMILGPA